MKRIAMGQIIAVAEVEKNHAGKETDNCHAAFVEGVLKVALNGTKSIREFVIVQLVDVSDPAMFACLSTAHRKSVDSNTGFPQTKSHPPPIHV
jgi:hypothetical protein